MDEGLVVLQLGKIHVARTASNLLAHANWVVGDGRKIRT